ncbi:MAG: M20/M25/M40 family metallo-hydrolase [Pseudomonadota bacterium]
MRERILALTRELMLLPGLSGHEGRVRQRLRAELQALGLAPRTDRLGNLVATLPGDPSAPSVMLFAHMDQLGFIVRKIERDGLIRVERLGGVPERALAAQPVLLCVEDGRDVVGVIGNKSHHATGADEKYRVVPYPDVAIDVGLDDASAVRAAGIDVGTPVVYQPAFRQLGAERIAGTAVDDRAGCAVLVEVVRALVGAPPAATVHIVFAVQEEFNLRGVMPAARTLAPDIAIQIDLVLATDTPDMASRGDVALGGGPAMSLYSFHGRGTLNGTLPHPALVRLHESTAATIGATLQRSAHVGALTETAYVQLIGAGVATVDLGFPMRYSHSANEVCDVRDLADLARLLVAAIGRIGPEFSLDPDDRYP